MAMKPLMIFALIFISSVTALRRATNTRGVYNDWRSCMVAKLPEETRGTYNSCHDRARGTEQHNFREGLQCVLGHYNLVRGTQVDLQAMQRAASGIGSPELKEAFNVCPRDDKNAQISRAVKCVIDHLERTCPSPTGSASGR